MLNLKTAPLSKPYNLSPKEHIPTRRDAQDLTSENLVGDELEFFPENPSGTDHIGRKYSQPFSGGDKRILSLGFTLTHPILKTTANVDVVALLNAFRHSAVDLEIGDRNAKVLRGHLADFVAFDQVETINAAYNDGTNNDSLTAVHFKSPPLRRLSDTSVENTLLARGQRFNLRINPKNTSPIPAESDWATDGIPQVQASMQVGYPPGESPSTRQASRRSL